MDPVVDHKMKEDTGCAELSVMVAHMEDVHCENSRIDVDAFHSFGKVDLAVARRIKARNQNGPRSQVPEAVIQSILVVALLFNEMEMPWVRVDDCVKYILKVCILPPD